MLFFDSSNVRSWRVDLGEARPDEDEDDYV